jgi:hypothetical protein
MHHDGVQIERAVRQDRRQKAIGLRVVPGKDQEATDMSHRRQASLVQMVGTLDAHAAEHSEQNASGKAPDLCHQIPPDDQLLEEPIQDSTENGSH